MTNFYELNSDTQHLPCSDIYQENLEVERCHICKAGPKWWRQKPLVLEYDPEDDPLDVIRVGYCYLLVRKPLGELILSSGAVGLTLQNVKIRTNVALYERELMELSTDGERRRFLRSLQKPDLVTLDIAKAGVFRALDTPDTRRMSMVFRPEHFCPNCGRIVDREMVNELVETEPVIDVANWNGADCFSVGHLGVVCTQKVVDVLSSQNAVGWTSRKLAIS